jgi:hypothetical protein
MIFSPSSKSNRSTTIASKWSSLIIEKQKRKTAKTTATIPKSPTPAPNSKSSPS